MKNKIFAFFLIAVLLLNITSNFLLAINAQSLKTVKNKIKQNKQKLEQKKKIKSRILNDILYIDRNINYSQKKLAVTEKNFKYVYNQLNKNKKEMKKIKDEFSQKQKVLSLRVLEVYKNKNLGFLEFLFTPKDFGSVVDYSYYFEKIIKMDVNLIEQLKHSYNKLLTQKKKIQKKKIKLESLKQKIGQEKSLLASRRVKKKQYLLSIQKEIQRIEAENKRLMEDSNKMAKMLNKSVKKIKKYFGTGKFIKPVKAWVSSVFGYRMHPIFKRRIFHTGVDLAAKYGTKVKAADSGRVVYAGRWGGYGNVTIIEHTKVFSSVYAHLSRIIVKRGDIVQKGKVIAYVGSSGYSTGPHLHFEIRKNGKPVNPKYFVKL